VYAQDATVHYGSKRQEIKDAAAILPHIWISILVLAFVIESIDLGDLPAFVITSQEGNLVWISRCWIEMQTWPLTSLRG
jgi:hypothetical protein